MFWGSNVLPLPAFVLEFAGVTANVRGHTSPAKESILLHNRERDASTYCTPKSPVLNTSMRFNPKHANISTLHLPKPLTATSFSISSSSLALTNILALRSPWSNFSASPVMYSALRCDRPAVRNVAMSFVRTREGEGKDG